MWFQWTASSNPSLILQHFQAAEKQKKQIEKISSAVILLSEQLLTNCITVEYHPIAYRDLAAIQSATSIETLRHVAIRM